MWDLCKLHLWLRVLYCGRGLWGCCYDVINCGKINIWTFVCIKLIIAMQWSRTLGQKVHGQRQLFYDTSDGDCSNTVLSSFPLEKNHDRDLCWVIGSYLLWHLTCFHFAFFSAMVDCGEIEHVQLCRRMVQAGILGFCGLVVKVSNISQAARERKFEEEEGGGRGRSPFQGQLL